MRVPEKHAFLSQSVWRSDAIYNMPFCLSPCGATMQTTTASAAATLSETGVDPSDAVRDWHRWRNRGGSEVRASDAGRCCQRVASLVRRHGRRNRHGTITIVAHTSLVLEAEANTWSLSRASGDDKNSGKPASRPATASTSSQRCLKLHERTTGNWWGCRESTGPPDM